MAQFTKRIDANIRELYDQYNSHWSPTWKATQNYGQIGVTTEFESDGSWYGGIKNLSLRFTNVTIPQGAVITSAKITLVDNSTGGAERTLALKIAGIDEDNTAEFVADPVDDGRTRTKTTALVDWDLTFTPSNGTARDSSDIVTIIQEIVDRGSWASGNALALYVYDDGTSAGNYWDIKYYSSYTSEVALLTINYLSASASASISSSPSVSVSASPSPSPSASPGVSASLSPSVSVSASPSVSVSASPSVSVSASPSASISPSASLSPSPSVSVSPSPSPVAPFFGLKIAKSGYNVLLTDDPIELVFSSDYNTLKYITKQTVNISFDASTGDISAKGTYTHNLGYYPYVEVYVSVNGGNYEYCPFYGAGATVFYSANVIVTTTQVQVFGEISGVSTDVWTFSFLIFVYKNNLLLS